MNGSFGISDFEISEENILTKEEKQAIEDYDKKTVKIYKDMQELCKINDFGKTISTLAPALSELKKRKEEIYNTARKRYIQGEYDKNGFSAVKKIFRKALFFHAVKEYTLVYETLTNVSPDQEFISLRDFLNVDNLSAVTFNPEKFKEYLRNILHIYFDLFKDSNEEQKELEEVFNNTFLEAINKLTAISLSFQPEFTAVSVKTKSAENVIFLGDKISQYIFDPAISYQAIALDKKKKDIASIKLSTSTEKDIQLFYKDKMTLEAIIALNEAGNTFITYGMIGKHMNPNASRITDSELTDIKNRVNRMRLTDMELVFKQPKKTSEGIITQYKGYLLNADEITFVANGKEASGIKINQPLIASWLYLWASDTGELQRMPINLIAPKIGNYDYAAALKNYLLRRIASMKKAPKLKRIILIKTIMENILDEKAYTESRLKHVRANIIQSTKDYLSELQNNGEISGYEITKKGNAVSAVKIKI